MEIITKITPRNRKKRFQECKVCGEYFYIKPSLLGERFTCSRECNAITKRNIPLSLETRKKLSIASFGKKGTNLGKKFSEEWRRKISIGQKNISNEAKIKRNNLMAKVHRVVFGKDNPSWKGGITKVGRGIRTTKEYGRWRLQVFKRDGFKCKNCGHTNIIIQAHHIEPVALNRVRILDISNGITLCKDCHRKIHKCKQKQ